MWSNKTTFYLFLFITNSSALEHLLMKPTKTPNNSTDDVASKSPQNLKRQILNSKDKKANFVIIPITIHIDKTLQRKIYNDWEDDDYATHAKSSLVSLIHSVQQTIHSLNNRLNIKLIINAVKTLKETSNEAMPIDASKFLISYCKHQALKKKKTKQWYLSILLSGRNITYTNALRNKTFRNGVGEFSGRSYSGSLCSIQKSCMVLDGYGIFLLQSLAHEFGHIMGLPHDGKPWNNCGKKYIMSPTFDSQNNTMKWSECSIKSFQKFYKSKSGKCLHSQGTDNDYLSSRWISDFELARMQKDVTIEVSKLV